MNVLPQGLILGIHQVEFGMGVPYLDAEMETLVVKHAQVGGTGLGVGRGN